MANPVSTRCPKCKAVLKLKSSAAVGKKVPCPKCQHPFVVKPLAKKTKPVPPVEDDFLNGLDEYEDDYGEEALPPTPSRSRSSKKSSKKKKSQPAIWKNPGVVIGGSAVGVLLIVGVALLASSVFSSKAPEEGKSTEVADAVGDAVREAAQRSGKQVNLAWLSDDSELIISVRVADLWNAPLIQSLLDNPEAQQGIAQFRESIGLEPGDIESITLGVVEVSEIAKSMASSLPVPGMMPGMVPDLDDVPGVFVIRTSKPVDIQKILSFIRQSDETIANTILKAQHNGKEFFRIPVPDVEQPLFMGVFVANEKTIVLGTEISVKTVIDSNGRAADSSRFAFANAGQHFLIAFVPSDLATFDEILTADAFEESSPASKNLSNALNGKLRGVAFGATMNEGISLQLNTNMQGSQAAQAVSTALSDFVQESLTSLAEAESTLPPNFKKYIIIASDVLKAASSTTNNTIAQLDLAIPQSSLMTLKSLQQDSMAYMFSGGGDISDSGTVSVPSEEKKPAKPIKAVDLEGFNNSWQTDISITNQPAGEAIKKLAGEMGLTPESDRRQNTSLSKQVTVNLQKKSRLEAIEEICRQIGVHPIYENKTEFSMTGTVTKEVIRFQPGPRTYPVQFAGPFLVGVTRLQEKAPNPTGRISLQVVATNLPASVVSRFRNNFMGPAKVEAILGPQGQSLHDSEQGNIGTGFGEKTENFIQTVIFPLKDLLRNVTAIQTVRGQLKFDVPTEIKTLKLDNLTQGAVKKNGDLSLTLKTVQLNDQPNQSSSIQFELSGLSNRFDSKNIIVELRDANDKLLEVFGSGGFGFGDKKSFDYQVEGKPKSVTLKIITQLADMNYDFDLNDIPLTSHSKMPVKIEPAKFSGHNAPVSLEFVKIAGKENFRKVQFKAVNLSDKGIDSIDMNLVFLDAGGKKLKDFPSGYRGETQFGSSGQQKQEPAVKKKATKQIEVTAFFMPKETKSVKAELKKVRFVDAETWKADKE
jgi:hypothetical protein